MYSPIELDIAAPKNASHGYKFWFTFIFEHLSADAKPSARICLGDIDFPTERMRLNI